VYQINVTKWGPKQRTIYPTSTHISLNHFMIQFHAQKFLHGSNIVEVFFSSPRELSYRIFKLQSLPEYFEKTEEVLGRDPKTHLSLRSSDDILRWEMIFMSIKNFSILKFNSTWIKFSDGVTIEFPYAICQWPGKRKKKKRTQPWKRRSTHRWASIIPTLFWNEINPMWMWTDLQLQWFTYNLNQTQLDKRIPPLALPSCIFPGLVTIGTPKIDISPTSKVLLLLFLCLQNVNHISLCLWKLLSKTPELICTHFEDLQSPTSPQKIFFLQI